MNYALEVDADDVLGVSPGATLQEIHDAYRTRVKKHHPDVGGDDWAFRAVARAYEILTHARVRSRVAGDWPWVDPSDEPPDDEPSAHESSPPPPPPMADTPPPP